MEHLFTKLVTPEDTLIVAHCYRSILDAFSNCFVVSQPDCYEHERMSSDILFNRKTIKTTSCIPFHDKGLAAVLMCHRKPHFYRILLPDSHNCIICQHKVGADSAGDRIVRLFCTKSQSVHLAPERWLHIDKSPDLRGYSRIS